MDLTDDDVAYVRLLIGDTGLLPSEQVFTDDDILLVGKHETSAKLTAAQLLDRVAGSELLLSKKIRSQDLETDGPAVARELRALADQLRKQDTEAKTDGAWGVATWAYDDTSCRPPEATGWPLS